MYDKISVDFTKTGLENVKDLLVDGGYPRAELEKVSIYTTKEVDNQGTTELYVGTADADFANRMTNAGVDVSTVPNAATDTDGSVKAGFTKIIKHNYRRVDPVKATQIHQFTDTDENGEYVDLTAPSSENLEKVFKKKLFSSTGDVVTGQRIFGADIVTEGGASVTLQYGENKVNYDYTTDDAKLCFAKRDPQQKLTVRLRSDVEIGDQVILFPYLGYTPHELVSDSTPIPAFETKGLAQDLTGLATRYVGQNAYGPNRDIVKSNHVYGVSINLNDVTDPAKLKQAYLTKAYANVPARQQLVAEQEFQRQGTTRVDYSFGAGKLGDIERVVEFRSTGDTSDPAYKLTESVGFYVAPTTAKAVAKALHEAEHNQGLFKDEKILETSIGKAGDATIYYTLDDQAALEGHQASVDTEDGRTKLKQLFEAQIGDTLIGTKKALKVEFQDPDAGGVVYDKDSFTFKISAAEGYEDFIVGSVYVVGDFTVGKFHVADELNGFSEGLVEV
jgi:hypothetical protein|nr:MAG TPA: hypothetical protein [Caudoviricetes sp.]